jgi:hypothetical protein
MTWDGTEYPCNRIPVHSKDASNFVIGFAMHYGGRWSYW